VSAVQWVYARLVVAMSGSRMTPVHMDKQRARASLPSVTRLLRLAEALGLIERYGHPSVTAIARSVLSEIRSRYDAGEQIGEANDMIVARISSQLEQEISPSLKRVFNLTGTVLHTNLGRALLPNEAIEAMSAAVLNACNLEYDLAEGRRGDRDSHLEKQLCQLTGAEAATVVNNNAAAILLVLNSLAFRREVPTSRGELVEIGGSFRLPSVMRSSGCKLVEVGTTNRTHLRDYEAAIGLKTGLVMKVHPSNYVIEGFTAAVPEAPLARLCRDHGVPFVVDLGSGALVDLTKLGLPYERTAAETIKNGADLVTFSGDKLLGGPQAGIIIGRAHLVAKIKRNPLMRALRVDKVTIASLGAVLRLYANPSRLVETLPTLRTLARPVQDIRKLAEGLAPIVAARLESIVAVEVVECKSEVGSGAQPTRQFASTGLSLRVLDGCRNSAKTLQDLANALRNLPIPVIGRIQKKRLILDLRTLEHVDDFVAQLPALEFPVGRRT